MATPATARAGNWLDHRRFMGISFLVPALLYIILLIGLPFVTAILFSLSNATVGDASFTFAGLRNFENIWAAPAFHDALRNSFLFTVIAQFFVLILANILAIVLTTPLPQRPWARAGMWFARLLLILPWATPLSLAVIGWLWMFDPKFSPIDFVLREIGLLGPGTLWGPLKNMGWIGKPLLAKAVIIFVHVWRMTPLATVILMAGLSSIPTDLLDQAKVDGSRFFRTLFQVKLPLILPITLISLLFSFIFTFGDITVVQLLTRGGPVTHTLTLPYYSYRVGIDGGNLAQGAAVALFIFPVLLVVAIILLRTASRVEIR